MASIPFWVSAVFSFSVAHFTAGEEAVMPCGLVTMQTLPVAKAKAGSAVVARAAAPASFRKPRRSSPEEVSEGEIFSDMEFVAPVEHATLYFFAGVIGRRFIGL